MEKFASVDMTDGVPYKKLLLFTVPLLIGNVFQQLYSTVDAIFLGRFVGDNALAAIGSSMAIFFLILMLVMGVAIGAGIMTSQYFGAKSREDLSYTIGTSITLTAIVAVLLTIFGPLATRPILMLLETPAEILDDSALYMNVLLWGILGLAYFNMFSGLLRGMGEAIAPLIYLIIASVLNIALNFLFIVVLGMGVFGAAIGTVIAQAFSSLLCLRRLMQMRDVFDMGWHYLIPKKKYVRQVLKLGIPTGASQAIFAVAMMIVQPLVNGFGPMFIAVHVIVMRIDGFVIMPAFSFGNAITVFTGQNVGAGKMERVDKGIKQCINMAILVALVLIAAILVFGRNIAGAFTETQEVIDMTMRMLWILAFGYLAFSANIVVWGVIRGAGDAMSPLWGALINSVFIRLPSAFLFVYLLGTPDAIMYSLLVSWVSNLIIAVIILRIGKWRKKGLVQQEIKEETVT
ncbi:MAG: MATE family efflux transporter [Oscillospiraceae bacterium]|nr:MATE family efflux transporter [Oscillospiraceae bacterium]MCL2279937.1 MATE family efflux transporter [Oscillospiraceae bacterium]